MITSNTSLLSDENIMQKTRPRVTKQTNSAALLVS